MRILFLTATIAPPGMAGLPRSWQVARHLAGMGHEVTVLASARHYLDEAVSVGGPPEAPLVVEGVRIIGVPVPGGKRRSLLRRVGVSLVLAWRMWRLGRQGEAPDLVIASTPPPLLTALAGLALARRARCPAVLEVRDLYPDSAKALGVLRNPVLLGLWAWAERVLLRRFDHLVAVTPGMAEVLEERAGAPGRVTCIPNGIDPLPHDTALPPVLANLLARARAEGRCVVVYGGNMGLANDVDLIAAAAEKAGPGIMLLMLGQGQRRAGLAARQARGRLPDLHLLDPLPRAQARALFAHADILVHAYPPGAFWNYCLPNKLFDYLAAGRPIVFAGGGSVARLLERACAGIVVPAGDRDAFAGALTRLARRPDWAARLGRAGADHASRHWRRAHLFAAWADVLASARAAHNAHEGGQAASCRLEDGSDGKSAGASARIALRPSSASPARAVIRHSDIGRGVQP